MHLGKFFACMGACGLLGYGWYYSSRPPIVDPVDESRPIPESVSNPVLLYCDAVYKHLDSVHVDAVVDFWMGSDSSLGQIEYATDLIERAYSPAEVTTGIMVAILTRNRPNVPVDTAQLFRSALRDHIQKEFAKESWHRRYVGLWTDYYPQDRFYEVCASNVLFRQMCERFKWKSNTAIYEFANATGLYRTAVANNAGHTDEQRLTIEWLAPSLPPFAVCY